ncbi:MAG: cupin domain-containing protein, partial [Gaiellaceae bacterium]
MPGFVVPEAQLEAERAPGDTAWKAVAIDARTGSEFLELHVARYEPGRSRPRVLDGVQEIMYAVSGRGTLLVDGGSHELEPGTAAYLQA